MRTKIMKTNFVVLSEESVKFLQSKISETEKRTNEYSHVLKEIRKDLKKSGEEGSELATVIDANWKRFLELHALQMPHVIYNGTKVPTICDWVEDKDGKFKLEKAIKSYRYTDDEVVHVDGCTNGRIERKVEKAEKVVLTFPSGYTKEFDALDGEGNKIVSEVVVTFVPKVKSSWGYTKTMVAAFIAAADDLLIELSENK